MAGRRLQQLQLILQRCTRQPFSTRELHSEVIQVTPKVSCFDQKVHIEVQGLPSLAKVTLYASTELEWQRKPVRFVSCSHYVSSQTGEVNLQRDASLGGTYTGVEPMGLFWSMKPCPSGPQNIRMVVKNVELPVLYKLSVYLGHLGLDELHMDSAQRQPFSTLHVERMVKPADVRRIPVKDGTVRGTLFLPPGEGPFPGVIDMFGMAGGLMEIRAAMLAAHGFAALALPLYRYDDLPKNFTDQTYAYFENAVQWLASQQSVCPGGIGIVAISGGADVGMMVSWLRPQVKALVHINGSGFSGTLIGNHRGKLATKEFGLDMQKCPVTEEGMILRDGWLLLHEDFIPLWERNVHLLVLTSDDDGQVHPSVCDLFANHYPEDRRHLVEVVHYPGAGHLLEPPYTPHCRFCYNPFFDANLLWGGRVKEHAVAQEDSWQRILQFLKRHLPSSPQEGPVQN